MALWRPVATLAIGALKSTSKDLEVATWLTEALVRMAGLSGLMAGASVIGGLVERHWDGLFPMPEEGDMETRVAAVAGLSGQGADGTLMQPLRKVALFRRPDGSPFSLWQYQAAVELSGITDPARRAQRIDSGVLPFEEVEKEARLAGATHWSAQRELITKTLASWKEMERIFDEKAGDASPAANRVRDLLEFVAETCRPICATRRDDRWSSRDDKRDCRRWLRCRGDARQHHRARAGAAPGDGDCRLVQAQRAKLADRVYAG